MTCSSFAVRLRSSPPLRTDCSWHASLRTQLLVTEFDFRTPERRMNLSRSTSTMLKLGVVPILNENDAVSGNEGYEVDGVFSDNDGLAALVATEVNAVFHAV